MKATVIVLLFTLSPQPQKAASSSEPFQDDPATALSPELQAGVRLAIDTRYREAIAVFKALEAEGAEAILTDYFIGVCHLRIDETAQALVYLRRAVEAEPEFPEAYQWLAHTHLREGLEGAARQVLNKGLRRFPRNKGLLELHGRLAAAEQ